VPLRYAVAVNSVSSIMLNKIDILSGLDEVLICMAYEVDGKRVDWWPSDADILARAKPIYERFPGWTEPIHDCRSMADLPENARRYVDAVERLSGAPICLVSVGPERHQTIERMARPAAAKPLAPRSCGSAVDPAGDEPAGEAERSAATAARPACSCWAAAAASTPSSGASPVKPRSRRCSWRRAATRSARSRRPTASPASPPLDPAAVVDLATRENVDLVVVGPEAPSRPASWTR
jgi:hypothetical protein